MRVDLLRFLSVGMSLKKVPFRYGPAVDEVLTATVAHLLTPTSQVTGQIVQGLGCWLELKRVSTHPFKSFFCPEISWTVGLRKNLSLEVPVSGSKAML